MKQVAVVGAGTMGNGIAHVFAQCGWDVTLIDVVEPQLEKALAAIRKNMDRQIKKGSLSEGDRDAALKRITTATELAKASAAELVVEAATEAADLKFQIFEQLAASTSAATILASNTSSISITAIAARTDRPDKVIGMHFMNPVPMMALVEVIRALQTSDEVYRAVHELSEFIGKVPVEAKDSPGFVANRILIPMINEAAYVYYEGLASAEGIDEIMKLGMAHPMGPLMLADLIGLDTCYAVIKVLHEGFGDSKYRPCPIWQQMVDAGYLGRKSGRGFYNYQEQ